ncbi:unnamed protein product [Rangifer tarandus platyrhynchus]|uniref:Uncharacterized protein n=1 Tax=Rangifer tarandus platyrhynchus TaxID=3082113 RepID=A0ABN8ZJJ2_RANTA|nr:unnamed protein product [Rangifer tarandus platyrhynchus]
MDLMGTALGVAGPPAWVWSPGAGEGEVSPKTQGMVVTQAVLGCRLVLDDGAIEDIEHTVSFECMHDGACGRHEVNTDAYTRLAAPPHCWKVLSASRPPVKRSWAAGTRGSA